MVNTIGVGLELLGLLIALPDLLVRIGFSQWLYGAIQSPWVSKPRDLARDLGSWDASHHKIAFFAGSVISVGLLGLDDDWGFTWTWNSA